MATKQPGFRLDGVHDPSKATAKQYFFGADNVHPWAQSYQFLAELGISMMQQVRAPCPVNASVLAAGAADLLLVTTELGCAGQPQRAAVAVHGGGGGRGAAWRGRPGANVPGKRRRAVQQLRVERGAAVRARV